MRGLDRSVEDMRVFCPNLRHRLDLISGGGIWEGVLRPLCTTDCIDELLDDIHQNRPVSTEYMGALRHLPSCRAEHLRYAWMDALKCDELLRPFSVTIRYAGDRSDPRCWVDGITVENGRHVWRDNSICPFLSSRAAWDWSRNTVADFVGHVSIWLVSWMVFQQCGVWIVGEHGSTAGYHLSTLRPNDLCWCRSGSKYRKCHLRQDQIDFVRTGI